MSTQHDLSAETLETIRRALAGIRFGSIELTIHDSQIVQVERREKLRLEADKQKKGGHS